LTRRAKDVVKERQIYITCAKEIVRPKVLVQFTGTAGVPPAMSAEREQPVLYRPRPI